jgi:AcrR family transcriptional regulator
VAAESEVDPGGRPRPGRDELLALARRALIEGERVDMRAFAAELGVNRVTLYRWAGSRDRLIVEVLWDLGERRIHKHWTDLAESDGPRVPEVMRRWTREIVETPGMRTFLHGQSELAIRLLTLRSGGFQPRLVALVRSMVEDEIDSGRVQSPLPIDELAYTVVRVFESYIYLPVITGDKVDPDMLGRVLGVLLTPRSAPGSPTEAR